MNKKAQDSHPILAIMAATIAVFVLVIVFIFFFSEGNSLKDKIIILFPSFNKTVSPVGEFQFVRYDLTQNKVQFKKGASWIEIPESSPNKEITFEDKIIIENN